MLKFKSFNLRLFLSVIIGLVIVSQASSAKKISKVNSDTIIFLSSSDSMRDSFDDTTKIKAFADTMASYSFAKYSAIKIISFSQKGKNNCAKVEIGFRANLKTFSELKSNLLEKKPTGKISASHTLEQTVRMNANNDQLNLVYIASDLDICNIDVCKTAKRLKKEGYKFSVNVLSLNVPQENQESLQCLAETTQGLFLHAKNRKGLNRIFDNIVDKVNSPIKDKISEVKIKSLISITAGAKFKIKWDGPNNKHDRIVISSFDNKFNYDYSYVNSTGVNSTGNKEIILRAPSKEGKYRIHYLTGLKNISLYSQYIEVKIAKAYLGAVKAVTAGSKFQVTWSGPRGKYDQIRILNPKKPNTHLSYTFTKLCPKDKASLVAPNKPGRYEIQYLTNNKVLAKTPLFVKRDKVKLSFEPIVMAGSTLYIKWQGPNNQFDQIRLVGGKNNKVLISSYASMQDNQLIKLMVPEVLGKYRIEYINSNKSVLASKWVEVIAAKASLRPVSPVVAGAKIRVHWQGPINEYDQIKIINDKKPDKKYAYVFVKFHRTDHARLNVPEKAGYYEIIYLSQSKKILARTALKVVEAKASILPIVKSVKAGTNFNVSWKGPGNQYDTIRILDLANKADKLAFIYVKMHRSHHARMIAPREAGLYEIQYLTSGKKILARTELHVE